MRIVYSLGSTPFEMSLTSKVPRLPAAAAQSRGGGRSCGGAWHTRQGQQPPGRRPRPRPRPQA